MSYSGNISSIILGFGVLAIILRLCQVIPKRPNALFKSFPLVTIAEDKIFSEELTRAMNKVCKP